MKNLIISMCLLISFAAFGQNDYEPSKAYPFGRPNPNAPQQIKDYEGLIGLCDCKSYRKNQDGTWADPVDMTWKFKYIMNGMAVQDETLKADGIHSGSIRQYNPDSATWNVHYYTTSLIPNPLPAWKGGNKDGDIVLFMDQKAPNGADGFYKIKFFDISKAGFNWLGAWVNSKENESINFPIWKIECKKIK